MSLLVVGPAFLSRLWTERALSFLLSAFHNVSAVRRCSAAMRRELWLFPPRQVGHERLSWWACQTRVAILTCRSRVASSHLRTHLPQVDEGHAEPQSWVRALHLHGGGSLPTVLMGLAVGTGCYCFMVWRVCRCDTVAWHGRALFVRLAFMVRL